MTFLRRFWQHTGGVALIEMAFVAPVLIILTLGALELSRYMLIILKVEKSGYVLTDIATQYDPATVNTNQPAGEISDDQVQIIFEQLARIMAPYYRPERQAAIMTSLVHTASGQYTIQWQVAADADVGALTDGVASVVNGRSPSQINNGVRGQLASFPAAVTAELAGTPLNENMLVGEIFFRYEPFLRTILSGLGIDIPARTVVRRMYFKPRNGDLPDLPPDFPVT